MQAEPSTRTIASHLAAYGAAHAFVDATCGAVVFTIMTRYQPSATDCYYLVLLYNLLAFGLQPLVGRAVDAVRDPRSAAIVGCLITGGSVFWLGTSHIAATLFAGVGNAIFHVGGGTISLNLTPRRASAPGIFVAPGAIGLATGILVGKSGQFVAWPFLVLLVASCLVFLSLRPPKIDYERSSSGYSPEILILLCGLLLVSIGIRSLVGMTAGFPWKSDVELLLVLTAAVATGKAVGGVIADRIGWIRIAVGALVVSAPMIAFGAAVPWLAIAGMFLFNMTMAVTLTALAIVIPGRPGYAFGLTCLALVLGSLPASTEAQPVINTPWLMFAIILGAAAMLYGGLRLFFRGDDPARARGPLPNGLAEQTGG
jgi:MFS transporter, FSR family, fosmidomycin resistance protein